MPAAGVEDCTRGMVGRSVREIVEPALPDLIGQRELYEPFIEQIPAPDGLAAIELLATVEDCLDDIVTGVPEADDVAR